MGVVAPAARSFCGGVPRRAAPVPSDATASGRAFGTNKPRGVAPPARGVMRSRDSSACRAGAAGVCVTKNEIVNEVQVQVEVVPAGGKRPLYSAPGHLRGVLGRDPSVCLAAVEVFSFSVPTRKRTKRTRSNVEAEAEVRTVGGGEKPVDPALDRLHKRMALELEALRELLKKAELIPRGPACKSKRVLLAPEPRMEAGGKTPSLKRTKVAQSAEPRKKVQYAQRAAVPTTAVCLPGVLFRAKVRRELLKMERAVLPDESINQRDLQRLSIAEYGRPSVMRQLGLFLIKADA